VVCESPNNAVGQFHGALLWSGQSYALDIGHLLLRGCTVRNTSWCYGLVVFAGCDSKLLMNDTAPQSSVKRGHLDTMIDQVVFWVCLHLIATCGRSLAAGQRIANLMSGCGSISLSI